MLIMRVEHRDVCGRRLRHNVLDEPVQQLGAVLDGELRISSQLRDC